MEKRLWKKGYGEKGFKRAIFKKKKALGPFAILITKPLI